MSKPIWLLGVLIGWVLASFLFFMAYTPQWGIGSALVPGLGASGLLVLVIGAIKMLGENVTRQDIYGILLMIGGIAFLGVSELEIKIDDPALFDTGFIIRATIFTLTFVGISLFCHLSQNRYEKYRGALLAIFSGSMFALSNLWLAPLMTLLGVTLGTGHYVGLFTISCIIVVLVNIFGVFKIQQAFQYGQAANLIPIQNLPHQTGPILVFFVVFMFPSPKIYALPCMILGVVLILSSSFLLAKRQAQLEEIK